MSCRVHPYETPYGEIKTIGLHPRYPGQPREERYAEWARSMGWLCSCGRDKGGERATRASET